MEKEHREHRPCPEGVNLGNASGCLALTYGCPQDVFFTDSVSFKDILKDYHISHEEEPKRNGVRIFLFPDPLKDTKAGINNDE